MKKSPYGPAYPLLLGVSGLFSLAGALTLLPWPWASWPNIMGYSSLCTFAPGATFGCSFLAGLTCVLRARLVRRRPGPVFVPTAALLLIGGGLVWSTIVWAGVKAQYTGAGAAAGAEAVSGASAAE